MTNITKTPDGYYVFPLSGWKKTSKAGNVYLSLSIKRRGKDDVNQAKDDDMNDPIPF